MGPVEKVSQGGFSLTLIDFFLIAVSYNIIYQMCSEAFARYV
jgi:hypothetical protein